MRSDSAAINTAKAADLVHRYFDAWNYQDVPAIADFFTSTGIYFDIPADEQYSGSGLLGYLADYVAGESDRARYALAGDVMSGSQGIAFRYYSYEVNGADKSMDSADRSVGAEFWVLLGDKVARVDDYYESRLEPVAASSSRELSTPKYAKSGLTEATASRYRNRLCKLMDEDKVYLQAELSLPGLAKMVNCSVNHLSQVINAEFGASFFEFLNQHRIADAKILLAGDPRCQALDVALKVGFNSNSTFYSAFKQICHVTPAQFRRQAHGS